MMLNQNDTDPFIAFDGWSGGDHGVVDNDDVYDDYDQEENEGEGNRIAVLFACNRC